MDGLLLAAAVVAGATLASAALIPPTRALALRAGAVDQPGPRKVHRRPMPRLGGLAVFASFTGVVLAGYLLIPMLASLEAAQSYFGPSLGLLREAPRVQGKLLAVLAGAAVCLLVGLVDDLMAGRIPVWAKLGGQSAAAIALVAADVRVSFLPFEWMNVGLSVLWLVGITNAFNLLDNMDGLSAGVAFLACLVLLINAWMLGEFFVVLLLCALMGALLGFLLFNFPPASVFLGDCGSLFIGFVMGSLTLLERYVSHASSTLFPVLMPVVVLAVPILDTLTVITIRLRERRPIYVGDMCHLSHRLVALGFSPTAAVLFLYLTTFALGLGAVSLTDAGLAQSVLVLLQTAGVVGLLLWLMLPARGRQAPETS